MAASSSARPTVDAVPETPTSVIRPGEVPVLEVTDLTVDFPTDDGLVHAVRGVSYSVSAGEVLAIVGESGSGKSVSSLALMGLLPKTAKIGGSALYRGTDLLSLSDREMSRIRGGRVAMIFQDPMTSLNPVYTIGHQLAEGVRAHNDVSKKEAFARARDLLGIVGIPNPEQRSEYYPHEFSGGMRQRVVIAMAMANDPEIIIADEPTTALDVTVQAQIMETLAKAQDETGAAIVLITHDLGVVAGVADSVLVMYAGRPVEIGSVDDIYYSARMPYTVGLLGSIPRVDGSERERLVPIKGSPPSLIALPPGCPFGPRCPLHRDVCDTAEPPLLVVAGLAHSAACYFSDELSAETVAEELFATDSIDDADPAGDPTTGVAPPAVAPTPTGALPVDDVAPASPEVAEGGGSPRNQWPRIGARRRP